MAAKKKKKTMSSTVSLDGSMSAAPVEGQAAMILDQPIEKDVHAGEEVVVAGNAPTSPGTSVDDGAADAGKKSKMNSHESMTSPYACSPVAIEVGPGLATYWVPKHLLRSPKWSATDAGATIYLPGVSVATGHTLVHYLYTGTYQALEAEGEHPPTPVQIKFKQAFLMFVLASTYELQDLERLAKEKIKTHGSHMTLNEVMGTVKKEFSKVTQSWFHEYLQARAEEQFDLDHTLFTKEPFIENAGKGTLHRFMTCHVMELFSAKLTHTLQRQGKRCLDEEKPDAVLGEVEDAAVQTHHCSRCHGGHQTGMCTASDEMSFEFPNASCEDVEDVISLENSSAPDCAGSESQIEEVSCLEVSDMDKDQSMVRSAPTRVDEELHEPTLVIEVEKHDIPAPKPGSEEPVLGEFDEPSPSKTLDGGGASGSSGGDSGKKAKKKTRNKSAEDELFEKEEEEPLKIEEEERLAHNAGGDAYLNKKEEEGVTAAVATAAATGAAIDLSGWASGWGSSNTRLPGWGFNNSLEHGGSGGNKPWGFSGKKNKDSNGFDFDFDAFGDATEAAPPAEEKPAEDDAWGFGAGTTKTKKKGKKGALTEESVPEPDPMLAPEPGKKEEDDPWSFAFGNATEDKKKKKKKGVVEEDPPPEYERPAEPESIFEQEPAKEEDPWGFAVFATGKKAKKGKKVQKEPKTEEALSPAGPEPELAVTEADAAEAEKEKDSDWGDWGGTTTTTLRKKKSKGVAEEETMPGPEEPEPTTEQAEFPEIEQEQKPMSVLIPEESMSGVSNTLCPRRSHHLLKGDRWKSCERCCAMLREISVQIAKENKAVLLRE